MVDAISLEVEERAAEKSPQPLMKHILIPSVTHSHQEDMNVNNCQISNLSDCKESGVNDPGREAVTKDKWKQKIFPHNMDNHGTRGTIPKALSKKRQHPYSRGSTSGPGTKKPKFYDFGLLGSTPDSSTAKTVIQSRRMQ
ncbi:hypothetical protein LIER_30892 [Lithospermum erythrorhizon]|uniref:Uncharacterized protein n=1 Tax=Lithospermum erythrorhizon TaxID=34254 RepID=A0AAV3RV32_LITER